jgi:hypothetical protein
MIPELAFTIIGIRSGEAAVLALPTSNARHADAAFGFDVVANVPLAFRRKEDLRNAENDTQIALTFRGLQEGLEIDLTAFGGPLLVEARSGEVLGEFPAECFSRNRIKLRARKTRFEFVRGPQLEIDRLLAVRFRGIVSRKNNRQLIPQIVTVAAALAPFGTSTMVLPAPGNFPRFAAHFVRAARVIETLP